MRAIVPARLLGLMALAVFAACERGASPRETALPVDDADTTAAAPAAAATADWPQAGPVNVRRQRTIDLTGDGSSERVVVTATGERYDSLEVVLAIEDTHGAALWVDRWTSRNYFEYETANGRGDEETARTVRDHIDGLLDDRRFHAAGMPPGMMRGDASELNRESVRYHLAELDWRHGASLAAQDATPPEAYRRIRPDQVSADRVEVVLRELVGRPTYNYYTGGEASYVIGWSEREQSFVRLFACC